MLSKEVKKIAAAVGLLALSCSPVEAPPLPVFGGPDFNIFRTGRYTVSAFAADPVSRKAAEALVIQYCKPEFLVHIEPDDRAFTAINAIPECVTVLGKAREGRPAILFHTFE